MKFINIIETLHIYAYKKSAGLRILNMQRQKTPLGRWNIHNYSQTMLKIKYANEDNCGICCENNKNITELQKMNNYDKDNDDEKYIYMMGYEAVCD